MDIRIYDIENLPLGTRVTLVTCDGLKYQAVAFEIDLDLKTEVIWKWKFAKKKYSYISGLEIVFQGKGDSMVIYVLTFIDEYGINSTFTFKKKTTATKILRKKYKEAKKEAINEAKMDDEDTRYYVYAKCNNDTMSVSTSKRIILNGNITKTTLIET